MRAILILVMLCQITGCSDKSDFTKIAQVESKSAELSPGEELWTENCKVCHIQGINGAPIIGNTAMWSKRIGKGEEALIANAISGFGLMPAKGGKEELSDDEVALAAKYMLSKL